LVVVPFCVAGFAVSFAELSVTAGFAKRLAPVLEGAADVAGVVAAVVAGAAVVVLG
jgi:hypothetical protein